MILSWLPNLIWLGRSVILTKIKSVIWQWRGIIFAAPSVTILIIAFRFTGLLQMLELNALDQLFQLRPQEPPDERIVIVDINEPDIHLLKRWPIPDADLVKILEHIKAQQPRLIGLDLYRDLPVEYRDDPPKPDYQDLVNLFQTTPNLIGIRKVAGESVLPPPGLKYPDQVGANDLPNDDDGKIRRFFLSIPISQKKKLYEKEAELDGFSTKIALKYLQKEGIKPKILDLVTKKYQLGQAILIPFQHNDGGYVQASDRAYQILINYRGPAGSFRRITMTEVLQNQIPPGLMRDRIVLIGVSAASLQDLFFTPFTNNFFKLQRPTSGIEIHANVISQLVNSAMLGRTMIKTWPKITEWLWIFSWSVLGTTLIWMQRNAKSLLVITSMTLAAVLLLLSCYLAFLEGWWIPLVPPLLALGGSALGVTTYIAKSAGDIRETFGRYLTDDVVSNLLENPEGLKLGGERRKITILTSDLRGFTATAERLPPEDVVKILNLYLGYMADVITSYQGTIDEFMGDGILVLFGAPTLREDDAERAIACALVMQLAMEAVNQEMKNLGLSALKMGIGINTGEVVVGNIGSTKRTKYGVVGSQVNLTYRIESYTTESQILISESTLAAAGPIIKINGATQVQPKGIKEPITIYDVGGIGGKYNIYLSKKEEIYLPLPTKIDLKYAILDGKNVSADLFLGSLIKLSPKGALVTSDHPLAPLTNIKINLLDDVNDQSQNQQQQDEDIYAKVLEKSGENGSFYVYFTAVPPQVEVKFENLYKSILPIGQSYPN